MELPDRVRVTGWAGSMAAAVVLVWALVQFSAAPTAWWALAATLGAAGLTLGALILEQPSAALGWFLTAAGAFAVLSAFAGPALLVTIPVAAVAAAADVIRR